MRARLRGFPSGHPEPGPSPGSRPFAFPLALRVLGRLQRRLERLAAELQELQEAAEGLAFALEALAGRLPADLLSSVRVAPPPARKLESVFEALARAGASAVEIESRPDHSVLVRIDGRRAFPLPRKLGALLGIIAAPTRAPAKDGLIGWRTYGEVACLLAVRTGRPQSPEGLTKHISKLRAAFKAASESGLLIETDRHGAVRFRLRAPSPGPAIAPEP